MISKLIMKSDAIVVFGQKVYIEAESAIRHSSRPVTMHIFCALAISNKFHMIPRTI